eukprot:snap_masked-scaffold720_size106930-processed-gene-0.10 protein:Tk07890 transcript:snap_masked-scaffold720_size106930-processed-gene-0.10-mRNA-1 annotation:"hypothetical protein L798_15715"
MVMSPRHRTWTRLVIIGLLAIGFRSCQGLELLAHVSQHGVRGSVSFKQAEGAPDVQIKVNLSISEDYAGEYSWGIYEFPIDYTAKDYCDSRMLGKRPIVNFDEHLGTLLLPPENDGPGIELSTPEIQLQGKDSIWGRSLVLVGPSKARICATIMPDTTQNPVKVAEARFTSPVGGSVWFTTLSLGNALETKIFTNLFHVQGTRSTTNNWKIYITDALDSSLDVNGQNCDFLQILYDPENRSGEGCSEEEPEKCQEGDLKGKFGEVKVGKRESMFTKSYHTDTDIELPELEGSQAMFLVLFDPDHQDSFFACAKIRDIPVRHARATFMHDEIKGEISFKQLSPYHPVVTSIDISGLNHSAGGFHVHEFPMPQRMNEEDTHCLRTGGHFNPFNFDMSVSPEPATGSFDKYEMGDLSGKYGTFEGLDEHQGAYIDPTLSLFGSLSIVGRSVVIHESPIPLRWTCANVDLVDRELITAVATYTYPIAGRIIFRQEMDDPFADTQIFVESLVYSDGTKNDTDDHRWHVHTAIPGKDYFNWTGRCLSAKGHFNPYLVNQEENIYNECVNEHTPYRCELGDLSNKLGRLTVAGRKSNIKSTLQFFTDINLPLTGPIGIIGRSIVIHDDKAPEHRGERMACTGIYRQYRHKAVAQNWFGNGVVPPPVDGKLEFIQDTSRSTAHTLVDLKGLDQEAYAYHIHLIPVQDQLEFPCTGDAVGDHFNPFNYDASSSPKPGEGTPDQYEIGDLSGKYGSLDGRNEFRGIFNDTNLPLFGVNSIVGRSVVIHKKYKAQRWACASIGWGFDPDEAREIRAVASFHHPNGYAWGYIQFSQVVYHDGSSTDTSILVRLKHPGKTNKDFTSGHNWSIFVNPVGHDASIKFEAARCTAAGYRWNPTFIQLAAPNDHGFYSEECGPDNPLRCEVGDLSGRHGTLSVGGRAYVVNDVHLPLTGDWFRNAIGKSIIIHGPDGHPDRMACANIVEDKDIIKFASIEVKSGFNLATFIEEVQAVMGIPEWFLHLDARATSRLYNGKCIKIRLHFTGPYANKLEQDFARLLRTGHLDTPSIPIPGYVPDPLRKTKLGYRECGSENFKNQILDEDREREDELAPDQDTDILVRFTQLLQWSSGGRVWHI